MSKASNIPSLIFPFIIGIVLGIVAKFTDGRDFLYYFPLFADVMGRFAMVTPFCGFLIWHIHKKSHYANFISSLPFTIFFTEWYLTAFTVRDWVFSYHNANIVYEDR